MAAHFVSFPDPCVGKDSKCCSCMQSVTILSLELCVETTEPAFYVSGSTAGSSLR